MTAYREHEALWFFGERMTVLVDGEETDGRLAVVEHLARHGQASPWHRQLRDQETFYVLEGELSFYAESRDAPAARGGPGTVFVVGQGVPHSFRVESERARFLGLSTPAGHERFFRDAGEPAQGDGLPPQRPVDEERLERACRAHGVEILGPPPGA